MGCSCGIGRAASQALASFVADVRGANAVEFALIVPVLLTLLLGMVYLAVYLSVGHSLAQIAADASRYAMVGLDGTERARLASRWVGDREHGYVLIDTSKLQVSTAETGGALRVTLAYDMSHLPTPPIVGAVITLPSSMERSSTVLVP